MSIETPEAPVTQGVPVANGAHHITQSPKKASPTAQIQIVPSQKANIETQWHVVPLLIDQICPSPYQPRLNFDEAEMAELVASVKQQGVQQPILVRTAKAYAGVSNTDGSHSKIKAATQYELVAGERRLRACKEAKRRFIPAIIRDDLTDSQAAELALLENIQRSNLTVIEEAHGYKRLMLEFRMKEERIAKKVGKSVQTVRDTLKILALPPEVQGLITARKLTASHGHHLLKLAPFEEICKLVARHAESTGITATALGRNLLPNARKLQEKKLVVSLDYRTKFDWRNECGNCPHKAYFSTDAGPYCAKPEEWNRKQTEAIERQKLEAARILDEAKVTDGAVDIAVLPAGSYRDLSYGEPPAGCSESCPCRSATALSHDPTKKRPICLNPERFTELVNVERQAVHEERKRKYLGFYMDAKAKLVPVVAQAPAVDLGSSDGSEDMESEIEAIPMARRAQCVALVVLTIISGDHLSYLDKEKWGQLCQEVATDLSLQLPWEKWREEELTTAEMLGDLQSVDSDHLLRFAACLLLGYEAIQAMRYSNSTPLLSAVLGHNEATQNEFSEDDFPEEEENGVGEYADEISNSVLGNEVAEDELDEFNTAEFNADEFDARDFEGEEFEDEKYHTSDLPSRNFQDEPYLNQSHLNADV